MMGRTHALSGAAVFGLAAIPAAPLVGLHPGELLLGTVVCAGAAVLPDIDHPDATISRTLGPMTRGAAWLVARASGGHRRGTHSLSGVAVVALLACTGAGLYAGNPAWLIAGLGLAVGLGTAGFVVGTAAHPPGRPGYRDRRHATAAAWGGAATAAALALAATLWPHQTGTALLGGLLVLVLSAVARLVNTRRLLGLRREWDDALPIPVTLVLLLGGADLRVVPAAIVLGVVVHIAGDMVTGGCPLGWPASLQMIGVRWFRVGDPVETGPVTRACAAVFAITIGWNSGVLAALT